VPYGDIDALAATLAAHSGAVAAVIMEPATVAPPPAGYLEAVRELTRHQGVVLIFDEIITGFRWADGGAQALYGVTPDLATFGKAIANGFSLAALVGQREIMELGDFTGDRPRVFLLSATHGGETHTIAAARATIAELRERNVLAHVWRTGRRLQAGIEAAARDAGVAEVVSCGGYPCSPQLSFDGDGDADRGDELRTLFLQETVARGVLMPYIAPSFSHGEPEINRTIEVVAEAFTSLRRVLDGASIEACLEGPAVKPVFPRRRALGVAG
jgi:glutamate-1-semialdehyde 2,1-aminomutase